MKSNLVIALLVSAIQAQEERLDEQNLFRPQPLAHAHTAAIGPHFDQGDVERAEHAMAHHMGVPHSHYLPPHHYIAATNPHVAQMHLPPGYAYPRHVESYYYHPQQYPH